MEKQSLIKIIQELLTLIEKKFYIKFVSIQALIIVSGLIETASFFLILPFINLVADPNIINGGLGLYLLELSGSQDVGRFILFSGIVILFLNILSMILSVLRIWFTALFANEVGFRIGDNLFSHYLNMGYEFHVIKNSSYLTKQITVEAIRIKNIMKSLMQMNSDLFMAMIIISGLMLYEPLLTLILISSISFVYFLLYRNTRGILVSNGRILSTVIKDRFKIINNSLGGISDIILTESNSYFIAKMHITGKALTRATTVNQLVALAPAKLLQSMILIILVSTILFYSTSQSGFVEIIMTLSAFIMAGFKIMPMFQSIYTSIANIKGQSPAIEAVKKDFSDHNQYIFKPNDIKTIGKLSGDIILENVSYTHPSSDRATINDVNIVFEMGQKIGIMGESGSGKSTLIKLIISLISPTHGTLSVGGIVIDSSNENIWKNIIGVIAQDIFLIDGSIAENIAFGKNTSEINKDKITQCAKKANILSYINNLPEGIYTEVGERGIQLSGGQKQRIGIARALYNNNKYLIMDEATSSLDKITEKKVLEDLDLFSSDLTIIMIAHRINTLMDCDTIYIMDKGKVIEKGNYQQLKSKSDLFNKDDF